MWVDPRIVSHDPSCRKGPLIPNQNGNAHCVVQTLRRGFFFIRVEKPPFIVRKMYFTGGLSMFLFGDQIVFEVVNW